MTRTVEAEFLATVRDRQPGRILPVLVSAGPFLPILRGIPMLKYYRDPALLLECNLWLQDRFPDVKLVVGPWGDFGVAAVPSAFGCPVFWTEEDPPYVKPVLGSIEEVDRLRPVDPHRDGLMPDALEIYRYAWKNTPRRYVEEYGWLDGVAWVLGPLENAALIRGYSEFLADLVEEPERVHKLLSIVTETTLAFLRAHEEVNGPMKLLFVAEHFPSQVGRAHFEEFCLPYVRAIFAEFPGAIGLYHNEGNVSHILDRIPELGAEIFHFGLVTPQGRSRSGSERERFRESIKTAVAALGDRMCLAGNVHPVDVMLNGTPQEVAEEARFCMDAAVGKAPFLLTGGGGMAPGTPLENVDALVAAAREYRLIPSPV